MTPLTAKHGDYMELQYKTQRKITRMVIGRRVNNDDTWVRGKPIRSKSTQAES